MERRAGSDFRFPRFGCGDGLMQISRRSLIAAPSLLIPGLVPRSAFADDASLSPVLGPALYSLTGRGRTSLYFNSIAPASAPDGVRALRFVAADGTVRQTAATASKLDIDPETIGRGFKLTVDVAPPQSDLPRVFTSEVQHQRAPTGAGKQVSVLLFGDSITNRGLGAAVRDVLSECHYQPLFIGTMLGGRARGRRGPGVMGEGREGWAVADFVYSAIDKDVTSILGDEVGAAASYSQMTKAQQLRINPFLRKARPDDPAQMVLNDYRFDFSIYLQRFSLPVPDVVMLGLGSNDVSETRQLAPDVVRNGLRIMCRAIREAAPKTRIGLWMPSIAATEAMRPRWPLHQAVVRTLIDLQRDLGDPLVNIVPVWSHMDRNTGWLADTPQRSGAVGSAPDVIKDPIHPGAIGVMQMAEPIAAYIAAVASGKLP